MAPFKPLTAEEITLLRASTHLLDYIIAWPAEGTAYLAGTMAGGNRLNGFRYQVGGGKLHGEWRDPADWKAPPALEVDISLKRLQRWSEQLPDEVRAKARPLWATDTRDLDALRRLVTRVVREQTETPTPEQQLSLF